MKNCRIKLFVSNTSDQQLLKVEFHHALLSRPQITVRGRTYNPREASGTFPLSSAVQALFELFSHTLAWQNNGSVDAQPVLSGEAGSLAASLDYAISKQPRWLCEMFGFDGGGISLIRRVLTRSNPERKRPGPVVLAVQAHLINSGFTIEVVPFINDSKESHRTAITQIESNDIKIPSIYNSREEFELCRNNYIKVIRNSLNGLDIFSKHGSSNAVKNLNSSRAFKYLSGGRRFSLHHADKLDSKFSLGLGIPEGELSKELCTDTPFKFYSTLGYGINGSIIRHLVDSKSCNFQLNFNFRYAIDLIDSVFAGVMEPDALILTTGTAAYLMNKDTNDTYIPFMLTPPSSPGIMLSEAEALWKDIDKGIYYYEDDVPGATRVYFDSLVEKEIISMAKEAHRRMSFTDAMRELADAKKGVRVVVNRSQAAIFAPYLPGKVWNGIPGTNSMLMQPMFVHRKFLSKPRFLLALETAYRNAWLELHNSEKHLMRAVNLIFQDENYLSSQVATMHLGLNSTPHRYPVPQNVEQFSFTPLHNS